jgi:hypothetical protein
MCVCVPDHQAGAPVAEVAHGRLLAGGLRVDIDDDGVAHGPERAALQLGVDGGEGVVQRVHVHAAERVDHQHALALGRVEEPGAAAGRVRQARVVDGADHPRLAPDVAERLLLVPGVVAERQAVGAGVEQLARGVLGDPEARGGVLAVDHHELETQPPAQARQVLGQAVATRAADDVSEEPDTHQPPFRTGI